MKISIIIPVYNEEATIATILKKVIDVKLPWEKEIIVIDDASRDDSEKIIRDFIKKHPEVRCFQHSVNQGKGAAVRTGITKATGDYVVIQDADLEYNPDDLVKLLEKVEQKPGIVIYGSRLTEPPVLFGKNKTPLLLHYFGNKFLSLAASILYGSWLTDMETGYKMFPRAAMKEIKLSARGFELEPEITAKLLKSGYKIVEVPITTKPRGYEEGKKLNTWKDGWKALTTLIKYRFVD